MRLMLMVGCLLPLLTACNKDKEEVTPDPPSSDTTTTTPPPPLGDDAFTIADHVASQENLSSMETALTSATQLTAILESAGPYTAFIPYNEAFAALMDNQQVASVEALVEKLGVEAISNILQAHVVSGLVSLADMRDKDVFTTLSGSTLTVTSPDGTTFLINDANLVETDISTDNGIVHIIDQVVNLSAASDGSKGFTVTVENVSVDKRFFKYGVFDTPVSGAKGPASPGQAYEFSFHAGPIITAGQRTRLSFAAKLTNTYDQFLAPGQDGLLLYNEAGQPLTGDITNLVQVYDASTKDDSGAEVTGPAPVQEVGPATGIATVTISNQGDLFTVRITNAQAEGGISPGVYGIHTVNTPLFGLTRSVGSDGLQNLAEDGDPTALSNTMDLNEGFVVPLSPGVFAIHGDQVRPVLVMGEPDRGVGLELLAEEGDPATLGAALAQRADVDSSGIIGEAVIGPGERYSFTVSGVAPGDRLTLVTMMMQSNDIVYSTPENGIPLFLRNGRPFNGNASKLMVAYDVGTEANEYPGAGAFQPLRGAGGATDANNAVRRVVTNDVDPSEDGFIYRPVGERIRVTITPN